jgi:hypothetical protein
LCAFQTIPRLTDCERTWTYCCSPLILLPITFVENFSFCGHKVIVEPTAEELELKDLKKMSSEIPSDDVPF